MIMKTHAIQRPITACLTLCAICFTAVATARAQLPAPGAPGYQPIELVTPETQAFALGQLAGKPVRGFNQEEFGTVSDFLIEPKSGRVHFAVAPAGGNTFRILPMSALQQGSGTAGVMLTLDRARWEKVGTISQGELENRVNIDAAHQQRLHEQFQLAAGEQPIEGLMRASRLKGREVLSGNEVLGTVEDVVIDFHNKIAAPLIKLTTGFGGGEQGVLIHFSRLQVTPEGQGVIANVNRGEFHALRSRLTPTGYPSGFNPTGRTHAAVTAVQQALDRDAAVPRGTVQAIPETRIVLRGAVDNQQKRAEIERAAQQAAPGVQIENQLLVRNR